MNKIKTKIICDFEGRFLSTDENFLIIFELNSEKILDVKRIFNFLHYSNVLNFIDFFNSSNNNKSKFLFQTFNNKNILCDVEIIILICNYNITIEVLNEVREKSKNFYLTLKYFNLIVRSKFLIGSIIPVIFSAFLVLFKADNINLFLLFLVILAVMLFHISANTFNDYFDWISGRDEKNLNYFLFSTGGSRVLDLKFVSPKYVLNTGIISTCFSFLIGLYFIYIKGLIILLIGLTAFICVYFYSAPPIHLASRYGLGELSHIFCLGPLIGYGCIKLLSDEYFYFSDFLINLPFGLIITGCLLINEYPDSKYDKICGKMNLPAVLDVRYIKLFYYLIVFFSFF